MIELLLCLAWPLKRDLNILRIHSLVAVSLDQCKEKIIYNVIYKEIIILYSAGPLKREVNIRLHSLEAVTLNQWIEEELYSVIYTKIIELLLCLPQP